MPEFFSPAVWLALAITMGAGLATVLGSLLVIFARETNTRLLAFGLAFAGGAMVYVSLVEIFVKSQGAFGAVFPEKQAYAYATLAFFCGVGLLVVIDRLVPNPHHGVSETEVKDEMGGVPRPLGAAVALGAHDHHGHHQPAARHHAPAVDTANRQLIARVGLMAALAITAHNLPEGLATFFATLENPTVGLPLAMAIAIHNIPEGVSIAVPVYYATGSRGKAILATFLSGLAEPVGALLGYLVLAPFLSDAMFGAVFGVIAGAMVFLALDELLPAARRYAQGHETVYGIVIGMAALALSLVLFK
jgi:zinc transporter, ZIP family